MATLSTPLIYLAGPSGAGKDTLLSFARAALGGLPILFAHRYVTRAAGDGHEAHVPLSAAEFAARLERGLFALHWDSHGLRYGIGVEIDQWRAAGCAVVVNGSRGAFPAALARYPDLLPVLVTASADTLRARLTLRGREDAQNIEERLARSEQVAMGHPRLVTIANDGRLEDAGRTLVDLLRHCL